MKLSIIIPLYNKAPYVTKALESVLAQTYTDYECLIINDGSTDDSAAMVEQWLLTHNHSPLANSHSPIAIRLITQANAGVSAARNAGIALAQGDYIAFLDADDWWEPTYLEEMVKLAEKYPDAGLLACNYIYYKPGKTHVAVSFVYNLKGEMAKWREGDGWSGYINYPKSYYENGAQVVWTGATLINRLTIEDCRLENGDCFQTGIKLGEDFLLWARMAMQYPVAFLNKPLAYYNNEVPATLRLTRNLHEPASNMLWQFDAIEDWRLQNADCRLQIADCSLREDWQRLLDKLRVQGLMEYWMSDQYHELAAIEMKKVSCPLPKAYRQPLWWLRLKRKVMHVGSFCKSLIRKMIYAK